jgi:hypothetical protein
MDKIVLDPLKFHLKYVVSYNHKIQQFFVDTTRDWLYHQDCCVPKDFVVKSAGWISCDKPAFMKDEFDSMTIWGKSEGYRVDHNPLDLPMIKETLLNGNFYFTKERKPKNE